MGGKNHQPCRNYLPESTRLSRAVSVAYIELETANVCLEDLILAEINGHTGGVDGVCSHLRLSKEALFGVMNSIKLLQDRMDKLGYKDLPSIRELDLDKLGQELAGKGMVDETAWKSMISVTSNGSFYASLSRFRDHVLDLVGLTERLTTNIEGLRTSAETGTINVVLEENQPGNLRVGFAQLYSSWDTFHREFLASSMLSTEIWYAYKGFGSLTGINFLTANQEHDSKVSSAQTVR